MTNIALTGSVAAGKTTVGGLFREWGATVIDVDTLVHEMQRRGEPVFNSVVAAFGSSILDPYGELDRTTLRRRILADANERRQLEAIVHPAVERRRQELLADARARGEQIVITDIPLLFEAGDPEAFDGVILVDAPIATRRQRLMQSRGFNAREADQLIALQLPAEQKRAQSHWIIDNDGDRESLLRRTKEVWQALQH
ncbi:MAG: dephospho-CoA kinase [Gemmatimonadales bacterium]